MNLRNLLGALLLHFMLLPLSALEIIGHRGASFDAPENTLASFRLGWEQQADADELDVYLSKDGQIIVIHDATTKRTTGVDKKVVEQTLEELRALDAGSWKGPRWAGEKLPLLPEVIATIPPGKRLFIEIKCGPEILPVLEPMLRASGQKPEQLVLISFNYDVLAAAKKQMPQYAAYWIAGYTKDKKTGKLPQVENLVAKAKAAGLDGLNLNEKFPLEKSVVEGIKAAGLKLYTWTVDDPTLARQQAEMGVDGITTNRAGWLREQLK